MLALTQGVPADRQNLERMIHSLRHRGPDGFGFYQDGPVGLAHARLGIIDLATGDQPMCDPAGEIWTVFNGEIFNYIELRAQLRAAGHTFRTASDTETIVHAYREYGDDFVHHLNGQFAIAIWDRPHQRLILARDRVGIRPLFYAQDGDRFLFASEVKAIAAATSQGLKLDVCGLAQILTFWSTLNSQTVFAGINSLPPGHLLSIESGRQRLSRYWDWQFLPEQRPIASREAAAEELHAVLTDSVRLQLRSDVPVGAYLSGGLDSATIVSLVHKHHVNNLRTFSVTFEESEFDESKFQREIANQFGTEHTTLRCTRKDIGEHFPKFVWHAESPVVRTAPVPFMMLAGLVRQSGYKVVLTGEGADEVFGGYDLFKEGKIRRFWARRPQSRWRSSLLRKLYPYLSHSPVANAAYANSYFGQRLTDRDSPAYSHGGRWTTTARSWNFFSEDVRQVLRGVHMEQELARCLPAEFSKWEGLARDQYIEAKTLLAGYLLSSQGDRVAMANSVESRVPFLDHRLIEFAGRLPARYKLRGLNEKAILKAAMQGVVPPTILARVKQPYRAPDAPSFFADGKPLPYVEELLGTNRIRDAGYFESGAVTRLFEKCRSGKAIGFADNMALVGIVSTMLVHEQFVRNRFSSV